MCSDANGRACKWVCQAVPSLLALQMTADANRRRNALTPRSNQQQGQLDRLSRRQLEVVRVNIPCESGWRQVEFTRKEAWTVAGVKEELELRHGIARGSSALSHRGLALADSDPVPRDVGGAPLELCVRQRGGGGGLSKRRDRDPLPPSPAPASPPPQHPLAPPPPTRGEESEEAAARTRSTELEAGDSARAAELQAQVDDWQRKFAALEEKCKALEEKTKALEQEVERSKATAPAADAAAPPPTTHVAAGGAAGGEAGSGADAKASFKELFDGLCSPDTRSGPARSPPIASALCMLQRRASSRLATLSLLCSFPATSVSDRSAAGPRLGCLAAVTGLSVWRSWRLP